MYFPSPALSLFLISLKQESNLGREPLFLQNSLDNVSLVELLEGSFENPWVSLPALLELGNPPLEQERLDTKERLKRGVENRRTKPRLLYSKLVWNVKLARVQVDLARDDRVGCGSGRRQTGLGHPFKSVDPKPPLSKKQFCHIPCPILSSSCLFILYQTKGGLFCSVPRDVPGSPFPPKLFPGWRESRG